MHLPARADLLEGSDHRRLLGFLCLVLVFGTLVSYGPVIGYDFTTYDDPAYVTENPNVQGGLTLDHLVWAFTTGHTGNWHPLTWLSHMLDCQLYGVKPGWHHFTNLLFHVANVLLLFGVLRQMTGATWRSAFVAALFAWHPLHVESVAWIAERKDGLSACFWLLTLWAYLRYVRNPQPARYRLALGFFACGLLAKPMVVTLPFVLLLLDYWPLRRSAESEAGQDESGETHPQSQPLPWARLVVEKWPFFLLAAASSLLTFLVQKSGGAVAPIEALPLTDRLANALVSYVRYLLKTIWPRDLAVFYPLPEAWPAWQVVGAVVFLLLVSVAVVARRRRHPALLVGWLWFLGTLVPVIGLVQVGLQAMADRYTYIPLIGMFIALVWGPAGWAAHWPQRWRPVLCVGAALVLAACLTLTWFQVRVWRDGVSLFSHALAVSRDRFAAENNLARALGKLGRFDEAAAHFNAALALRPGAPLPLYHLGLIAARRSDLPTALERYQAALKTQPDYAPARFERANILVVQGKLEEAVAQYKQCLRTDPDVPEVHRNLGKVLIRLDAVGEAVDHFKTALRLDPSQAESHDELAGTLQRLGQMDAARLHFAEAVRLKPDFVHARLKLGLILAQEGRFEEAKSHLAKAIQLEPTNAVAHYNLAAVFESQGRFDQAAAGFAEVVRLAPADADAHGRLGAVLAQAGKLNEAIAQYREAIRLQPDWVEALRALAVILATQQQPELRNGAEAVRLAERASELTAHRDPRVLTALDEAYAEASRFADAIRIVQQVQALATSNNQPALAEKALRRLELYRAGKPYRE